MRAARGCCVVGAPRPWNATFFALCAGGLELDCPKCGEYLNGEFATDGLVFQSGDSGGLPSKKSLVRVHQVGAPLVEGDLAGDDFAWLTELCIAAGQTEVLRKICLLYGTLACPVCAGDMMVMAEIQRSHAEENADSDD